MLHQRSSGLLAHITSLPSAHGIGDLGPEAYRFADFLRAAGQTYWQILPLTPVDPGAGFSPYSSPSAFAGNPLLISLEKLVEDGLLTTADCADAVQPATDRGDFIAIWNLKIPVLNRAAANFAQHAGTEHRADYQRFCADNAEWLDNYVLFKAIQEDTEEPDWTRWPDPIRRNEPAALAAETERLRDRIETLRVLQYLFFEQWHQLKTYCEARKIHFIGDIPFYVQHNSADVWAYQHLFKLDAAGKALFVAGAPPDLFSTDGQRWGSPVYDWTAHERDGYAWWVGRLRHQFSLYGLTRLDHFLGLAWYWEIPAHEPTARVGKWVRGPLENLLHLLYRQFTDLPIIAEDLGERTPDVQPALRHYALPGMRLTQFGFGDDMATAEHAIHNLTENTVAYSGTHDNNTIRGWFRHEANAANKANLSAYTGAEVTEINVAAHLIRLTLQSVARLAVFPVQDVLNLDETHRMNVPGEGGGNWRWRLEPGLLTPDVADRLLRLTRMTGRI
ncbi:MAG: 4-alpha-glucanotransferase [Bacteroidetes bacterium]|nr:4-alpha-glucanotransferase [Fibrella sp.]